MFSEIVSRTQYCRKEAGHAVCTNKFFFFVIPDSRLLRPGWPDSFVFFSSLSRKVCSFPLEVTTCARGRSAGSPKRSFGRKVDVGLKNILTNQHCDGLAKLCLLESKVGLQTREVDGASVCASEGGAAAIEALSLLQDRRRACPEHLPDAPCFQKTVDGLCPSSPKKELVRLERFDQHSFGTMNVR